MDSTQKATRAVQIRELLENLQAYMDEQKWLEHDLDALRKAGKVTANDLAFLKDRQTRARAAIEQLEPRIVRPVIQMFPTVFQEMPYESGTKRLALRGVRKAVTPAEKALAKVRAATAPAAPESAVIEVPVEKLVQVSAGSQLDTAQLYNALVAVQTAIIDTNAIETQILSSLLPPLYESRDILREQRNLLNEDFELLYPADGSVATVTAGTLIFDLLTGDVTWPDGSTKKMSDSLQRVGKAYARSIYIESNKLFTVQFDDGGKRTIEAEDFLMESKACRRVTVELGSTSQIQFLASTNPNFTYQKMKPMNRPDGKQIMIETDPDTQFTDEITTNAHEEEYITGLMSNYITITKIMLISKQNRRYRVNFWKNSNYETTDVKTDAGIGSIDLNLAKHSERIANTGLYRHNIHDMNMSYDNDADDYTLYLSLQNLSSAAKSAGSDGAVILYLWYYPRIT